MLFDQKKKSIFFNEHVQQLATNLKQQLVRKGKHFLTHSVAVDEALTAMHDTTTGKDLSEEVSSLGINV